MTGIEITPLAPGFGAEICGVDLRPDIDDAIVGEVRAALLAHKVVLFRKQSLDAGGMTRLAERFGEPTPAHPGEPSVEGHPTVLALDSEEGARADVWPRDLTFQ